MTNFKVFICRCNTKLSNSRILVVDNPSSLPLLPMDEIRTFQGDLKKPLEAAPLDKLMRSILDHRLFIAKAVFYENGIAHTEDGHQTLNALNALRKPGYTTCDVVSYKLSDGLMKETERTHYDTIMIPCQIIVPKGETEELRCKDAAAKPLQINSQYAKINPATTFFDDLGFSVVELDELLSGIEIADLDITGELSEKTAFLDEFNLFDNSNCLYPIVPRFSEKYDAVIIISDNETDAAFLESALQIRKEQSYKNHKKKPIGKSMVITARRFQEIWKSKS